MRQANGAVEYELSGNVSSDLTESGEEYLYQVADNPLAWPRFPLRQAWLEGVDSREKKQQLLS